MKEGEREADFEPEQLSFFVLLFFSNKQICKVAKAQCRPTREMFMTRKLQPPLGPLKEREEVGRREAGGSEGRQTWHNAPTSVLN